MEDQVKLLIAVGASVTANCQACFKTAFIHAQDVGIDKKEIQEAIAIARVVRKGAFGKMDKFALALIGGDPDTLEECPFGSTEKDVKGWIQQNDQCGCK